MNTKQNHKCNYTTRHNPYDEAIDSCFEVCGKFWVTKNKCVSQVNYCPFCGVKAPMQADLVLTPSEEDKILAALNEDAKNNPIPDDWDRNLKYRNDLMWLYSQQRGSDSIIGLHVCDNYLEWEKNHLLKESGLLEGLQQHV